LRRGVGYALLALGTIALVVPQANLGLQELRWISRFAFPGEAIAATVLLGLAYYCLGTSAPEDANVHMSWNKGSLSGAPFSDRKKL
jgi:hypothetical protein